MSDNIKYCFTYLGAVCRALLYKNSKIYLVVGSQKDIRPIVYFKNGSHIKTITEDNTEGRGRGRRAEIIEWQDCYTPSKEELDEILNSITKGMKK